MKAQTIDEVCRQPRGSFKLFLEKQESSNLASEQERRARIGAKTYEVTIDSAKTVRWYAKGKLHREDGPAVERANGDKEWYKNGRLHREDGPAVEWTDGAKFWCKNGEYHREDGPAVERANGDKKWYKNGQLHREDVPAVERADGSKEWYKNDQLHREDGPAVEYAGGSKFWYIEGKRLTEAEFAARQRKPAPCEGKKITVEGVEYILTAVAGKANVGS